MQTQHIHLSLSEQKLAELFRSGLLCAADISCQDTASRDVIARLCLQTCARALCDQCELCQSCPAKQLATQATARNWINIAVQAGLVHN